MTVKEIVARRPNAQRPLVASRNITDSASRRRSKLIAAATGTYVGCALVAAIAVGPFVWMLSSSFKEPGDVISLTPHLIPHPFTLENYTYLVNNGILPFVRFLGNSAYITVLVILGRLFVCALGAYGFARLQFRGRDLPSECCWRRS